MLHPGTDMAFIDDHRITLNIKFLAFLHPCGIRPFQIAEICNNGCCARTELSLISERIGFVKVLALVTDDKVLVHLAGFRIGNEPLPYADVIFICDDVSLSIPVIELTDDRYTLCIRSPHCEVSSVYSVDGGGVRTELLIKIVVRSMTEKILIQF